MRPIVLQWRDTLRADPEHQRTVAEPSAQPALAKTFGVQLKCATLTNHKALVPKPLTNCTLLIFWFTENEKLMLKIWAAHCGLRSAWVAARSDGAAHVRKDKKLLTTNRRHPLAKAHHYGAWKLTKYSLPRLCDGSPSPLNSKASFLGPFWILWICILWLGFTAKSSNQRPRGSLVGKSLPI